MGRSTAPETSSYQGGAGVICACAERPLVKYSIAKPTHLGVELEPILFALCPTCLRFFVHEESRAAYEHLRQLQQEGAA